MRMKTKAMKLRVCGVLVAAYVTVPCSPIAAGFTEIISTFDSPPNAPGSSPLTGGVNQPTRVVFGNPTVETAFGSLTESPLVFEGYANYEQIEYRLVGDFDHYHISVDLASALLNNSDYAFSILLDCVDVFEPGRSDSKNVYFHGSAGVRVFNPGTNGADLRAF